MTEEEGASTTRPGATRRRGGWLHALGELSPWGQRRAADRLRTSLEELAGRADAVDGRLEAIDRRLQSGDERVAELEHRADAVEAAIRTVQDELAELRDGRTADLERRLDVAEAEQARLRDEVVPALVERGNLLVDRLATELEELGSLVERMLLEEPLPVPGGPGEKPLAEELSLIQPALLAAFRGEESEISHRLEHHLARVAGSPPVLDLGCGRGELLLLLREAGIEAWGVERDPALAQGARRRGLQVLEGDVLAVLEAQPAERWGAVTAIHLLGHLGPSELLRLLAEVRRVLRPGGVILAECPNPHSLRVGAALYWLDPTHGRPLLPETLELYLKATGLEVREREMLHPFPEEQRLAGQSQGPASAVPEVRELQERLDNLTRRLDDMLSGPRDFAVVAAKADAGGLE